MDRRLVNLDKLTYAGNMRSLEGVADSERYGFCQIDIVDADAVDAVIEDFRPQATILPAHGFIPTS